jgi:hypothetical protein
LVWVLPYLAILATSVTPVSAATGDVVSYLLDYGPVGIAAVLFGLGYIVPRTAMTTAVASAREDLVAENVRLIAENTRLIAERDAALKIAQEQVVPLLTSFVGTTSALLPLLQDLVSMREDLRRDSRRNGDR